MRTLPLIAFYFIGGTVKRSFGGGQATAEIQAKWRELISPYPAILPGAKAARARLGDLAFCNMRLRGEGQRLFTVFFCDRVTCGRPFWNALSLAYQEKEAAEQDIRLLMSLEAEGWGDLCHRLQEGDQALPLLLAHRTSGRAEDWDGNSDYAYHLPQGDGSLLTGSLRGGLEAAWMRRQPAPPPSPSSAPAPEQPWGERAPRGSIPLAVPLLVGGVLIGAGMYFFFMGGWKQPSGGVSVGTPRSPQRPGPGNRRTGRNSNARSR